MDGKDLLWVIKGVGINFGIVVSVIFKVCLVLIYIVWSWVFLFNDLVLVRVKLREFDNFFVRILFRSCLVDVYFFWN